MTWSNFELSVSPLNSDLAALCESVCAQERSVLPGRMPGVVGTFKAVWPAG